MIADEIMDAHWEIGNYLRSKFPVGIGQETALAIAETLELEFQEFGLGVLPSADKGGVVLSISLLPQHLTGLVTRIRTLKMDVTDA